MNIAEDSQYKTEVASEQTTSRIISSGHFVSDQPPSGKSDQQRSKQVKSFSERLWKDTRKPRFYIELFTLVAVGAYTAITAAIWYTSHTTLQLTEQAYLNIGEPVLYLAQGTIFLPVENSGKIPATDITTTIYIAVEAAPWKTYLGQRAFTFHNKLGIAPGNMVSSKIDLASWTQKDSLAIEHRTKTIFAAAELTYNNGFDRVTYPWCSQTTYLQEVGKVQWTSCPDGEIEWLKQVTAANNSQWPQPGSQPNLLPGSPTPAK